MAASEIERTGSWCLRRQLARKASAMIGMSSARSRSGGSSMTTALIR